MRQWIDLIEGIVGWEHELHQGYAQFRQRWEDHVEEHMVDDAPLLTFDQYVDYAVEIADELSRITLYRGMLLRPDQIESIDVLGVHWSREWTVAKGFSHSGWSIYDDRFQKPQPGALSVIIGIAPIHADQCDIVETLAVTIYGGEDEVCMKRGQPVKIAAVYIDGVLQEGHPLVGQTRQT
jgi:hypothetical protein